MAKSHITVSSGGAAAGRSTSAKSAPPTTAAQQTSPVTAAQTTPAAQQKGNKANAQQQAFQDDYNAAIASGKTVAEAKALGLQAYQAAGSPKKQNQPSADQQAPQPTANNNQDFVSRIPSGWNTETTDKHLTLHPKKGEDPNALKVQQIIKDTKANAITAESYKKGIDAYSGYEYSFIRESQVKGATDKYGDTVRSIEAYIKKAPKFNGKTYRGIKVDDQVLQSFIDASKKGNPIDMKGMSSWSSSEGKAKNFTNGGYKEDKRVMFVCEGGQPQGTSITHLSRYPSEKEVIVSGTQKWKIKSYHKDGDIHWFEVEAI